MSKFISMLRNNPKKSVFFGILCGYAVRYLRNYKRENELMRRACYEALTYGRRPLNNVYEQPYCVTVVLNPAASGGKARKKFEQYCAPLLHLAGLKVSVIRTEMEGQAKDIVEIMKDADAILIAGGDGSLMEAVTGLLRRNDADTYVRNVPLGILPVGQTNRVARALFPHQDGSSDVELMSEATMAIVRQLFRPMDVLQVTNMSQTTKYSGKKIYGLREVQIGAFCDAHDRLGRYWYLWHLKSFLTYFFAYTTSQKNITWNVNGDIQYVTEPPNKVIQSDASSGSKWWNFMSRKNLPSKKPSIVYTSLNDQYKGIEISVTTKSPSTSDFNVSPLLNLSLGPNSQTLIEYVKEGWKRETSSLYWTSSIGSGSWCNYETMTVRLDLDPSLNWTDENPHFFFLDGEKIEIQGPLEVNIIPSKIFMFCHEKLHRKMAPVVSNLSASWWQRPATIDVSKRGL